jgi:hypothetical protein
MAQQAQSDGLSKIKAVNNDPVCIPRMDTATYTIQRCTNAVDGCPARTVVVVEKSTSHRANGTDG